MIHYPIVYGVKYRTSSMAEWEWDSTISSLVKYLNINDAYKDYENKFHFEWRIEELPEELI